MRSSVRRPSTKCSGASTGVPYCVTNLLDVKARLGHRVAGLGPHGGKRPEALDAGMDEMGEVDDSAGLEDAEGVDDRIAGHGRVS